MNTTLERRLAIRQGKLVDIVPLFDLNTILHASEIMNLRRTAPIIKNEYGDEIDLRYQWFWTPDFPLSRVEDKEGNVLTGEEAENGDVFLYMAKGEINFIFMSIRGAVEQLRIGDFELEDEYIQTVVGAESTIKINISDPELGLIEKGEFAYLEIDTKNHEGLNQKQKAPAEIAYGSMKKREGQEYSDFEENMKMLRKEGKIEKTRFHVQGPTYVRYKAKEGKKAVVCPCWLGSFGGDSKSGFFALDWRMDDPFKRLLGMLKSWVRESEFKEIDDAYQTLAEATNIAIEKMNPEREELLSRILEGYRNKEK